MRRFLTKKQVGVLGKSVHAVRSKILADQLGANLLKATVEGEGISRRYRVLGANLIGYLEAQKRKFEPRARALRD